MKTMFSVCFMLMALSSCGAKELQSFHLNKMQDLCKDSGGLHHVKFDMTYTYVYCTDGMVKPTDLDSVSTGKK